MLFAKLKETKLKSKTLNLHDNYIKVNIPNEKSQRCIVCFQYIKAEELHYKSKR